MTQLPQPSPTPKSLRRSNYRLEVNSYDRFSSVLVALLIMISVTVFGLVVVYFARKMVASQIAIPVTPVDVAARPADAALGLKRDLEPPGIEDAPELNEPQLQDTLSAISLAASQKTALLSDEDYQGSDQASRGKGQGDARMAGSGGGGDAVNEPKREVRFEPQSLNEYARWIDFYKIEIGVLGRDNKVYYAYNVSKSQPDVRTGEPKAEQRLYMNSAGSPLAILDNRLVRKAGIGNRGRIVLQFYPPEAQAILFGLEKQAAGERSIEQVLSTVFRVTPNGREFEFSVADQKYRY